MSPCLHAQEVEVQKQNIIRDNVVISFSQCTMVGTDLWTGKQRVLEGEAVSIFCRPNEYVARCTYVNTNQQPYADEMYSAAIMGKSIIFLNDNTRLIGDTDSKIIHSEMSSAIEEGRVRIAKVCSGIWDYESNVNKTLEEEKKTKKKD